MQWYMLSYSTGITWLNKQYQNQVHGDDSKLWMHLWGRHSSWVRETAELSSYIPDSVTDTVLQREFEQKGIILLGLGKSSSDWLCPCTPPLPFYPACDAEGKTSGFLSFQGCLAATDRKLKHSVHFKSTTLIVDGFSLLRRWLCCDVPSWWTELLWCGGTT